MTADARTGGVRPLVKEAGGGEPLVLVHGSWDDHRVWAQVVPELSGDFRVVAYDRRGHGDDEDPREPGTRCDDENDLAALLETRGLAPAHVVGNSFGGSVALGLLARRPDLFRSATAHEPPLLALAADDPSVGSLAESVEPLVSLIERGEVEEGTRRFVDLLEGGGAWASIPSDLRERMVRRAPTFVGEQRDPHWASIDVDALLAADTRIHLTRGERGPRAFAIVVERLAGAVPGVGVTTIADAAHVPHATHPEDWAAAVRRFAAA